MTRLTSVPILTSALLSALLTAAAGCDSGDPGEVTCPPEGMIQCDPIDQLCCDPYDFCLMFYSANRYQDRCRDNQGEVPEGGACQIYEIAGPQGCQTGHTCLRIPEVDTRALCYRLCRDDSDCVEGTCSRELPGQEVIRVCIR